MSDVVMYFAGKTMLPVFPSQVFLVYKLYYVREWRFVLQNDLRCSWAITIYYYYRPAVTVRLTGCSNPLAN